MPVREAGSAGWQCQLAAVAPLSPNCRGTGEACLLYSHPCGDRFFGQWVTVLQNRGQLLGGSTAACIAPPGHPPWPPFAQGLPCISSHWAAAGRFLRHRSIAKHSANCSAVPCLRIPGPAFLQHVRAAVSTGNWRGAAAAMSPADAHSRCFRGCRTKLGIGAHPNGSYLDVPCGPLRKRIYHISPGGEKKKKEASGADVILQCLCACVSGKL